jgi:CRISPR-associated protein Cmr5
MKEQTLDQKRAEHAFQLVLELKRASMIDSKKVVEAKAIAPELRAGLADWIERCGVVGSAPADKRLLIRVIQGDSDFLRYATAECLAYLQWLVRFTDAEFRDVPDQE